MCVCPFGVRPVFVRPLVAICLDHFLDPEMCNIALKYPIERKKEGKRGVPLDTKCNLISMEIKVNQKMSILGRPRFGPFCGYFRYDVGDVTVLRLSCAKALKGHLALQV